MNEYHNTKKKNSEKGQALVLMVIGMVALLGFTALAVDGGMVYSDRRHAQNAADASSLAGGGAAALVLENNYVNYINWSCGGNVLPALTAAETAAIGRAGDNGYAIDADMTDNHGVDAVCDQQFNGSWLDKYIDIITMITADTDTAFAHFVFSGPLRNTVTAVTRVRPRAPLAFGHAIVSVNETQDCNGNQNGVIFGGSIDVEVHGGGIFSNGCMSGNGNGLNVNVDPGNIVHVGEYENNHGSNFYPSPSQGTGGPLPRASFIIPPPDCSQVDNYVHPSNEYRNGADGHIPSGNYSEIKMNGEVILEGGGLYCMYGDFDAGNNNLTVDPPNEGVTIYLKEGSFITNGYGIVRLSAPPIYPDPSPALPGILMYLDETNSGLVKLRGNSNSWFVGTILAPGGTIDIAGTTEHDADQFNTQLIGKDVVIGGNADININFNGSELYMKPTTLELHQ
jgi:hypothetical protein